MASTILDEIEAAFNEVNVVKLTSFLDKTVGTSRLLYACCCCCHYACVLLPLLLLRVLLLLPLLTPAAAPAATPACCCGRRYDDRAATSRTNHSLTHLPLSSQVLTWAPRRTASTASGR